MTYPKKSRKLLLISTALMIITLASVLTVYASVVLGTFPGSAFTVNNVTTGTVTYSTDGSTGWTATPTDFNVGGTLYARFELTSTSYSGPATITWQLQENNGGWTNVGSAQTTTVTLTGSAQTIYASASGSTTGNHNWGGDISTGGSYRVTATISTA
jgi:hypothetical protein